MAEETTQNADNANIPEEKKKKGSIVPIIVILLLLLVNGYLLFFNWQTVSEKKQISIERDSIFHLKEQLQIELDNKIAELEDMRGENEELNSKLDSMLADLDAMKKEINTVKWQRNKYKKQLVYYQKEVDRQIDRSNKEIALLKEKFKHQIDSLNVKLTAEVQEKETLQGENNRLSDKVEAGSFLKAHNTKIQAFQVKGSKVKEITKAKKITKLKISFSVAENRVADPGDKEFILRLIGPDGATMSTENNMFKPKGSDKEEKYTIKKMINFQNKDLPVSYEWTQTTNFQPGPYKVEIYYDNQITGTASIELR